MKFLVIASLISVGISQKTLNVNNPTFDMNQAKKCMKSQGSFERVGKAGTYQCISHYSDGFKPCQSSDQCKGGCIIENSQNPAGFCKPNNNPFGCFVKIEDFKSGSPIVCRD